MLNHGVGIMNATLPKLANHRKNIKVPPAEANISEELIGQRLNSANVFSRSFVKARYRKYANMHTTATESSHPRNSSVYLRVFCEA